MNKNIKLEEFKRKNDNRVLTLIKEQEIRRLKAKQPKEPKRKKSKIKDDDKILIVTEGETEINYINFLINKYKVDEKKVKIIKGGAPSSVLKKAKKEQQNEKDNDDRLEFDKVYCVFDKDGHPNFKKVRNEIKKIKKFEAIISVPCLEFWFLLHYKYSRAEFVKARGRSPCENCIKELENIVNKKYGKSDKKFFSELDLKIETATNNAIKAENDVANTGELNPSTQMYILVEKLEGMGKT